MANLTSQLVPNQISTPSVPNASPGVQIAPANPTRNGLLVWNVGAGNLWLGLGPGTNFVTGTIQPGQFQLNPNDWVYFGGVNPVLGLEVPTPPFFGWTWTAALFALVSAGTGTVTVLEF